MPEAGHVPPPVPLQVQVAPVIVAGGEDASPVDPLLDYLFGGDES